MTYKPKTTSTSRDPVGQVKELFNIPNPKKTPQLKCEAMGGRWDGSKCIMPTATLPSDKAQVSTKGVDLQTPEVFKNEQGRLSGTTIPGEGKYQYGGKNLTKEEYDAVKEKLGFTGGNTGRTFLGLAQEDVEKTSAAEIARGQIPEGAALAGTAAREQRDIRRKMALAQSAGQIDMETAMQVGEQEGIDWGQAFAAGTQQVVPSALGYGTLAAGGALAVNAIPGAGQVAYGGAVTLGAVAGAVKGFYSGVTNNIKSQKQDLVSGKSVELSQRKAAIKKYISAANANPARADEYNTAMNIELSLIRRDYNTLVKKGNEDLRFWGADATKEMIDYKIFFKSTEPTLILAMQNAILKPEPSRAYLDIGGETNEEI